MRGTTKVLDALNQALSEELTAINQYFLHAEMYDNWGYRKLASFIKKDSIEEMKHAETLIERILFLEGTPNMSKYQKINIGSSVPDMIHNDLKLELSAVEMYNKLVEVAVKEGDHGSAELLRQILRDEEKHVDDLEAHVGMIKEMGLQNYLAIHAV